MIGSMLCTVCGRSYDRQIEKDETTAAIIEWAAKRARAATKPRKAASPALPANFSGRYCLECRTPLTKNDFGKPACPYCGVA